MIQPTDKIFVAGNCGMVGSAIVRALHARDFTNIVVAPRSELTEMDLETLSSCLSHY